MVIPLKFTRSKSAVQFKSIDKDGALRNEKETGIDGEGAIEIRIWMTLGLGYFGGASHF